MRFLKIIGILSLVVLGISFALINADPVTVRYYVGESSLPLSLLLVLVLGLGILIGLSFSWWTVFYLKFRNFRLQRKLALEKKQHPKEI